MLKAALSHFVAARDRSLANLNNYLARPAGVAEHPDVVGEIIKLVEEIESAGSCINLLNGFMNNEQEPEEE